MQKYINRIRALIEPNNISCHTNTMMSKYFELGERVNGCVIHCLDTVDLLFQLLNTIENILNKPGIVGHTCNSSYMGGRDQEDCNSMPVWAKS
jgi:hypothetical protein